MENNFSNRNKGQTKKKQKKRTGRHGGETNSVNGDRQCACSKKSENPLCRTTINTSKEELTEQVHTRQSRHNIYRASKEIRGKVKGEKGRSPI